MRAPVLIACPYCTAPARLVRGTEIYPARADLADRRFWRCDPCDAHVGLHRDGRPLGRLAGPELRRLRQRLHRLFDPHWMRGPRHRWSPLRKRAYRRLAEALGIAVEDCHVGHFDEARCRQGIEAVLGWGQPT